MGVIVATVEDEGEDTYLYIFTLHSNILLTDAISNIAFRCAFLPLYPFDNDIDVIYVVIIRMMMTSYTPHIHPKGHTTNWSHPAKQRTKKQRHLLVQPLLHPIRVSNYWQ